MHTAAITNNTPLLDFLVNTLGADLEVTTHHGRTPLMEASLHGKIEAVKFLVDSGADIEVEDHDERNAEMLATGAGEWDVVRVLSARGKLDCFWWVS